MRASSARSFVLAATLTLAAGTEGKAHRSDDYLQAARIALEADRILITLDLTPGIDVASSFLAAVDHDHNGSLSTEEQRGYVGEVVGALRVAMDERPLEPRVVSWLFPDPSVLRRGEGRVRLQVQAALPGVSTGPHRLLFWNAHLAGHSAYLANALVPESARVSVTAQHRDDDQSELVIDYTVHADSAHAAVPLALGGLAAALLMAGTSAKRVSPRPTSGQPGTPQLR